MNLNSPNAFYQYQNKQNEKKSHSLNPSLNSGEQQLEGSSRQKKPSHEGLEQVDEDANMDDGGQDSNEEEGGEEGEAPDSDENYNQESDTYSD